MYNIVESENIGEDSFLIYKTYQWTYIYTFLRNRLMCPLNLSPSPSGITKKNPLFSNATNL